MADIEAAGGSSSYQNSGPGGAQSKLGGGDKIRDLQNDVDQLADVMKTNINKVLERGDRMDTLNERSELLSSRANEFRINSRSVRRKYWWQNAKLQMLLGMVAMALVIIIIYSVSK